MASAWSTSLSMGSWGQAPARGKWDLPFVAESMLAEKMVKLASY